MTGFTETDYAGEEAQFFWSHGGIWQSCNAGGRRDADRVCGRVYDSFHGVLFCK